MALAKKEDFKKKDAPGISAKLLSKMTVDKDARLTRIPIETGRIRNFWSVFKSHYSDMMLLNLLFVVFLIPAILILFLVVPNMEKAANAGLNFSGNSGLGYPGATNDPITGMVNIYNIRISALLMLIPCFSLAGIGASGLFYCCRNLMWGAPMKIKTHFFRGIKKGWWQYLVSFTFLGGTVALEGFTILNYLKHAALSTVTAWDWVGMIFASIFSLGVLIFVVFSLPMTVSFKFGYGTVIKNSAILAMTMILLAIILLAVLSLPLLLLLSSFTKIVLYVAVVMIGVSFYALAITAFAQTYFDNFIIAVYEYELKRQEKESKKQKDQQKRVENKKKKKR